MDAVLEIGHLEPVAFLTSTGSTVSMVDLTNREKRPTDVTFVKFRCNMDVAMVDKRVKIALNFHSYSASK